MPPIDEFALRNLLQKANEECKVISQKADDFVLEETLHNLLKLFESSQC